MKCWKAVAEYADGTFIEEHFPYNEDGNYMREADRQFELESHLISRHNDCIFYSVSYEEV